ncbi:NAD(P)/FAD-dependent oxidoreductase [Microbispora rosea]|uniref:NAD(P)/FAD-dependent oxidoreductase n=1 Tax=Microbispora rosea TaxID=58117 RepID=UPI00135646D7|nr:FAD-dependent oxidoreductase [Microbispora rosea]GIH47559.1 glycine oxidase ThiO [Microbispora rosea subsp. rosea]
MPESCDVVIIGGGVIGCAIAHRLAARGTSVVLVDAGQRLGLGASDGAMGGILTQTEPSCLGPLSSVIKRSRDAYPGWLEEIRADSGVEVPVLDGGDIQVALDEAEMERLESKVLPQWKNSPFAVERLTAADARSLEPLLSERVVGGFLLPEELALDPRVLMAALATAVLSGRTPIRVLSAVRATGLRTGPSGVEVDLHDGRRVSAEQAVVAAGHLSGVFLPSHRDHLFPIKGVAFDVRPPGAGTYPLRHHIFAEIKEDGREYFPYLVPRHDGRVAVGVTYEENVGDVTVTAAAIEEIRRGVAALMPRAATWPIGRRWAGLRPGSADHMPVIGHVDDHGRVVAATGHSGLGVTLAPVTAELVAALVGGTAGARESELLAVCRPDRPFPPAPAPSAPAAPPVSPTPPVSSTPVSPTPPVSPPPTAR